MIENSINNEMFDYYHPSYIETEKQFLTTDLERFEHFKEASDIQVIEQLYLSQPNEPYSLRLRETITSDGIEYTAALKDRGVILPEGLRRLEIETAINPETYTYYKSQSPLPTLRKLRARPFNGVTIDWCEGRQYPIIEVEDIDNDSASEFLAAYGKNLTDVSGSSEVSSEALAYALFSGDLPLMPEAITPHEILALLMRKHHQGTSPVIICISGRSGSGKSTVTNHVLNLIPPHLTAARISTDDYHRGKTWLESTYGVPWTNWDAPEVYDATLLGSDLRQLMSGESIRTRRFNFNLEETVVGDVLPPSDFILVEGIYAGSPDLAEHRHVNITIPTPLATSIGRRLKRDRIEGRLNASLGNAEDILRYQLEIAEPMHRQQLA